MQQARSRDVPRGFLIKNGSLFELARKQPASLQALSGIEDVTPKILRKEGESILAVIRAAKERAPDTWPGVAVPSRERTRAAAPATCGEAIEVPEIVFTAELEVLQADVIPEPGAKMSRQLP